MTCITHTVRLNIYCKILDGSARKICRGVLIKKADWAGSNLFNLYLRDFLLKIYKIWLFELPVFNVIWRHLVTVPLFFIYFLIFKHFFLLFGRVLVESTRKPVYSDWTRSSIIQNCFNLPGGYIPQKYIKNLFSNKKRLIWLKRTKPEYWEINENRRLEKTALGQTRDFSDEETCDRSH